MFGQMSKEIFIDLWLATQSCRFSLNEVRHLVGTILEVCSRVI